VDAILRRLLRQQASAALGRGDDDDPPPLPSPPPITYSRQTRPLNPSEYPGLLEPTRIPRGHHPYARIHTHTEHAAVRVPRLLHRKSTLSLSLSLSLSRASRATYTYSVSHDGNLNEIRSVGETLARFRMIRSGAKSETGLP
jgi:hypothetical protein